MILLKLEQNNITRIKLSDRITGSYQIFNNRDEVIATVNAANDVWQITPTNLYKLTKNGVVVPNDSFNSAASYGVESSLSNEKYQLYIYEPSIIHFFTYELRKNELTIGREGCDINYASQNMANTKLTYNENVWTLETSSTNVYANDILVRKRTLLHGDIIFIDGLKIVPYSNRIIISNIMNYQISVNGDTLMQINPEKTEDNQSNFNAETERSIFENQEYFTKAPRFSTIYQKREIVITPPPEEQQQQIMPTILTVGPQMTMMLTSSVNLFSSFGNLANGKATFASVIPSIVTAICMFATSLLWPTLTRRYNRRTLRRAEAKRIRKYSNYLSRKEKEIINEHEKEKQVLLENNVSPEECQQIIYARKRNLWERDISQADFLTVRLGIGTIPGSSTVNYSESDFSTNDDVLVTKLEDMLEKNRYIANVPQCISLVEKDTTAIIGTPLVSQKFINSMLLQLMTFHSFLDLKIVVFTNSKNAKNWEYCDVLPHCWNDQRNFRYIATNENQMKEISANLMKEFTSRKEALKLDDQKTSDGVKENSQEKIDYMDFPPYYLIIVDDLNSARNIDIIKNVLGTSKKMGFSLLIKNDRISNLPSKCTTFINVVEDGLSGLFESQLMEQNQKQFQADINNTISMYGCAAKLSNIPFAIPKAKYELPKSISFLDMYNVGNIEQLNTSQRWINNNPISSLSVPVGIDQNGSLFNMDIHEKAYGPHGLVAGTTGSGKSEWIITYILSLAVNFNPDEVQFVLIDYKGGGLAGSFENSQVGIRLPHLVGTITNLDKSEVRRAIASIESELKRRQRLFNEAREKLKDSSMNIYKYQDYYRQGLLDEPMSHLLIISDEFAELKSQQPEFLEQLVSTARIGRSLGVHLILATQKPSGVVDDQIWSNSRFKVCLRVAEVADSNDMLKKPDAAYLKQTGAFYLQVGNDEYYMLGQSAYAGTKYIPSDTVKKKIDTDLHIIDKVGKEIYTVNEVSKEKNNTADLGEELLNILKYVDRLAKEENFNPRKLWLDRIPNEIFLDNVKKKYNYQKEKYYLNPVVGEYDDPYTQSQKIYTLPLPETGNVVIGGSTGSGKELTLLSLIYSLSSTYTLNECNIYVLDFGAQILKVCESNPIVANVINGEDTDQVDGLFTFIRKILKERKLLFSTFGGDYDQFIKTSGKTLPSIVVMLNLFDNLLEKNMDYGDIIREIATTCTKYGIFLIVTNTKNLNIKFAPLFPYKMVLNMNSDDDYQSFFPKNKKVFPSKAKARGIFEQNDVIYEFQVAIPSKEENINSLIEKYNAALFNAYKATVPSVPYLPKFVLAESLIKYSQTMERFPVGIKTGSITTQFINIKDAEGLLVFGINLDYIEDFMRNMIRILPNNQDEVYYLLDPKKVFQGDVSENITYIKDGFDEVISNLEVYVNDIYEKIDREEDVDLSLHSFIFIYGVEKLLTLISANTEKSLANIARKLETVKNVHLIISDSTQTLRQILNNPYINALRNDGIVIGPAANEQIIIDIRKYDIKPRRDGYPDDYAYYIQDGKAQQFKIIEDEKSEEEE